MFFSLLGRLFILFLNMLFIWLINTLVLLFELLLWLLDSF